MADPPLHASTSSTLPPPPPPPPPPASGSGVSPDDAPSPTPPGPAGAPPTYAPTQPQILVVPLPDAPSFFWGRTLQGEVYVKGLGEARTRSVESLTVAARLIDRLPGRPDADVFAPPLPPQTLYPPPVSPPVEGSSSTTDRPFPTSHRFAVPLPPALPDGGPLPASLDLGSAGEVVWAVEVRLRLLSGEVVTEIVRIEGAPPDLALGAGEEAVPAEASLERDGVCTRLLLACKRPRVGDALHIGVEVRPTPRARTGLAGLVAQPDPAETLRPLRRMRVELIRLVDTPLPPGPSAAAAHTHTHTTVMHASGKSLRYPGRGQPPLRLLFTLPTALLHPGLRASGGEISARTQYHNVHFVVRATLGFGLSTESGVGPIPGGSSSPEGDWSVEQGITIRPNVWHEPRTVVIERGLVPALGTAEPDGLDDEDAREAYRRKGRDVVGAAGTTRAAEGGGPDEPPPFDDAPGPSGTTSASAAGAGGSGDSALPSFNESEAQMRSGAAPLLNHVVPSENLVPVSFDAPEDPVPDLPVRRGSLTGELSTWVEYDGYETFSIAPPPAAASFGVGGSMDLPPEGEEGVVNMGDMVARLGFAPSDTLPDPAELMEQLGLGQGTRIVDLQDDLPPGIDEPSLPALPGFGTHAATSHAAHAFESPPPNVFSPSFGDPIAMGVAPMEQPAEDEHDHPPSFDASEAAEAVGGVARSRVGSIMGALPGIPAGMIPGQHQHQQVQYQHQHQHTHTHTLPRAETRQHEAPPGYFGATGGPPAYS